METPFAWCWKEFRLCVEAYLAGKWCSPTAHWNLLSVTGLAPMHLAVPEQAVGNGAFVPGYNKSHSSGKWLSFFFLSHGTSGQPWSAGHIWYPGLEGSGAWCESVTLVCLPPCTPTLWVFSEPFSSLPKTAGVHRCAQLLLSRAAL